jgi:hypothetical protein
MKNFFSKPVVLSVFLAFFLFFSCTAKIDGNITANGTAVLTINMSLGQRITALIRRTLSAAGGQEPEQILDGASIARSMSQAPGIDSVTLRNTSQTMVEGQIRISQINTFLAAADGKSFITFEQTRSGGRCEFSVNQKNGPLILEHLSLDVSDYLNVILAPIATGDEVSKAEYLELVETFYNKQISDEIAASKINVSIEFPGAITSVKGGTFAGRKANFDIPLIDLLVLDSPLTYEVNWR